jgi:hypothetical protein
MRLPNGHCPVCQSRIIESDIDDHPSIPETAIQNFWCPKCERVVASKTYSLRPKGSDERE